jgi:hypothetical protein
MIWHLRGLELISLQLRLPKRQNQKPKYFMPTLDVLAGDQLQHSALLIGLNLLRSSGYSFSFPDCIFNDLAPERAGVDYSAAKIAETPKHKTKTKKLLC